MGERFDAWFKEAFRLKYGKAFASLGDRGDADYDRAMKLVGYHLAGNILRDKKFSFNEDPSRKGFLEYITFQNPQIVNNLQDSFEAVVGNLPVDMGGRGFLIPPRGMSSEEFIEKLKIAKDAVYAEAGITPMEGSVYENFGFTPQGSALYRIKF